MTCYKCHTSDLLFGCPREFQFSCILIPVKLLLRPVKCSSSPVSSNICARQLSSPSQHFAWSAEWTHHLTVREWDLYWVQRKTSSSFEFMLCRSCFSSCEDSCCCRCRVKETHSLWPKISKTHQELRISRVSDAWNQLLKWALRSWIFFLCVCVLIELPIWATYLRAKQNKCA